MSFNYTDACSVKADFGIYILYMTGFISFASLCESLLAIFIIWRTEKLHNNKNMFVLSLAFNDIILSVAFFFNQVSVLPLAWVSPFRTHLRTKLLYGICNGMTCLSIIHMGIIAADRCIKVSRPFFYVKNVTRKRICLILACAWLFVVTYMFTPAIVYRSDEYHERCFLLHQSVIFYNVEAGVYVANCFVVFLCYFKIAHVAYKHKQTSNHRRQQNTETQGDVLMRNRCTAAMRSAKYFFLMFGVFFSCTFPPLVTSGIDLLDPLPDNLGIGFFSLIPIHSVINFLIYAKMNKDFRQALAKMASGIKEVSCKRRN